MVSYEWKMFNTHKYIPGVQHPSSGRASNWFHSAKPLGSLLNKLGLVGRFCQSNSFPKVKILTPPFLSKGFDYLKEEEKKSERYREGIATHAV